MNEPGAFPNDRIYALRLSIPNPHSRTEGMPALRGQLEHVISGRRYEFDAGERLLACLLQDLARVAPTAPPKPG